jgi:hypothetical protein
VDCPWLQAALALHPPLSLSSLLCRPGAPRDATLHWPFIPLSLSPLCSAGLALPETRHCPGPLYHSGAGGAEAAAILLNQHCSVRTHIHTHCSNTHIHTHTPELPHTMTSGVRQVLPLLHLCFLPLPALALFRSENLSNPNTHTHAAQTLASQQIVIQMLFSVQWRERKGEKEEGSERAFPA